MSETDELLKKAYYRPGGYQGAASLRTYLEKQKQESKSNTVIPSLPKIREWLAKQQLVQLHQQKAPPNVSKPDLRESHFTGLKMNDLHMIDLLTMPKDPQGYSYILSMIDCATRYKAAVPLGTKLAGAVAVAIKGVYDDEKSPLKWPKVVNVDAGTEFKGEVKREYEKHGTRVRVSEPGNHTSQAFVESFNRVLGQRLFKSMEAKELSNDGKVNKDWADDLPEFVKSLNSEKTRLLGVSPDRAVELAEKGKTVQPSGFYIPKGAKAQMKKPDTAATVFPQGFYRVRTVSDRPVEGGPRRRATDIQWSNALHTLERVKYDTSGAEPTLYFMSGMKHGYKRQDLLYVPNGTAEKPPKFEEKPVPALALPPKPKKVVKPRYRAEPKNLRQLISGVPIGVSSRGRILRAS